MSVCNIVGNFRSSENSRPNNFADTIVRGTFPSERVHVNVTLDPVTKRNISDGPLVTMGDEIWKFLRPRRCREDGSLLSSFSQLTRLDQPPLFDCVLYNKRVSFANVTPHIPL